MNLHFSPNIDTSLLIFISILATIIFIISIKQYRRNTAIRTIAFSIFIIALLNPSIVKEEREYIKDTAVIVVDQSPSQNIGNRMERTNKALTYLKKEIEKLGNFNLRIIKAPQENTISSRTDLFNQLDQAIADIPQRQRAGVIFISDGQVHDLPKDKNKLSSYGPVHLMISGDKNEKDRQIFISYAPAYGLVGDEITIRYKIIDTQNIKQKYARTTVKMHNGNERIFYVPTNKEQSITVSLEHPSQNIFSIEVENIDGEISYANNKAAVIINGVRDRMKVLLVSGIPHMGERTWRNLLTSDPNVDLVHFTILREPHKQDFTPKHEMSLIAFPFRELFEIKLYDFDLIIFDRYRVNNILPEHYFRNIAQYVKEGGAFLEASGPAFATKRSIYNTAIGEILPAEPTGNIYSQIFKPKITKIGVNHPITKNFNENWGTWLRYIDVKANSGDVLMSASNNSPLLTVERVRKGRVAQIASDQIWLWSRGYDGGGPHIELLRRIVHWLMKEPELDELALNITVNKNIITISKQNHKNIEQETISLTLPDGSKKEIILKNNKNGLLQHKYKAKQLGVYMAQDSNKYRKFAIIGDINPPELRSMKSTDDKFKTIIDTSHGTSIWLSQTPKPKIISSKSDKRLGGNNLIALKSNRDYTVTSIKNIAIIPQWLMLLILLSSIILLWWKEGQR